MIDAVASRPELQPDWLVRHLQGLIAVPSVNSVHPEEAMTERVSAYLEGTGCELTLVEVEPRRPSLAAVLRGTGNGPTLVLNGHTDTVSPDDLERWSVDPFGGEVRDQAVWGRGAVDMKGGLVCQIACAHVLASSSTRTGTLVLHFAMGEETGEPGTLRLIEHGFVGDYGITTEPTGLAVAIGQRGVCSYWIRIHGRSSHAACPQTGRNPVARMGELLAALDEYQSQIAKRSHPLFPPPTCTPTLIRGGVEHHAIADRCELIVDRRMLPGETRESVMEELGAVVGPVVEPHDGFNWEIEPNGNHYFQPAEIADDSAFASRVLDHVEAVTGTRPAYEGTPYGSDVRNLINDAGMEAITFGPGRVDGCHCPDEHLPIADLQQAAIVISRTAIDLLVKSD